LVAALARISISVDANAESGADPSFVTVSSSVLSALGPIQTQAPVEENKDSLCTKPRACAMSLSSFECRFSLEGIKAVL
jgi:hypothetical protein